MPTYEYECKKCGKTFDEFQSINDEPLRTCTCGDKGRVRRMIGTGAGILFKGSGFYETDYRSDSYKKAAAADSSSASSKTSETTTKSTSDKKGASKAGASSSTSSGSD